MEATSTRFELNCAEQKAYLSSSSPFEIFNHEQQAVADSLNLQQVRICLSAQVAIIDSLKLVLRLELW
jgi:hypothetical protein